MSQCVFNRVLIPSVLAVLQAFLKWLFRECLSERDRDQLSKRISPGQSGHP